MLSKTEGQFKRSLQNCDGSSRGIADDQVIELSRETEM